MAEQSGTPLSRRLGIRPGHRVLLLGQPRNTERLFGSLPDGVSLLGRAGKPVDVVVCFARRYADLHRRIPSAVRLLKPDGGLWLAWPKKASGTATDLDFNAVQQSGLSAGLVDNKICALNETWSALRFVRRLRDRPQRSARPGAS